MLPWLSDDPVTNTVTAEISTVFSRQLLRWFSFRKSQLICRDSDQDGFSAFLASNQRIYDHIYTREMILSSTFSDAIQQQWNRIDAIRQLPDGQPFSVYRDQVINRLKPYRFTRLLQLKDDVQDQDIWSNWLEYLSFEKWHLEQLTTTTTALEPQFLASWKLLAEASQHPGLSKLIAGETDQLAHNKANHDFIRATKPYKNALTAARFQKLRVDWLVKQAHILEAEISEQRHATADMKRDTGKSQKRRRDEDGNTPPEPDPAKRAASAATSQLRGGG